MTPVRVVEVPVTPVTDVTTDLPRPELGPTGWFLWEEMTRDGQLPAPMMVTLLEACRMADRLDRLHAQLEGKGDWLSITRDEEHDDELIVIVDRALAESRQHATAFKTLAAELMKHAPAPTTQKQAPVEEDGVVTSLLSRLAGGGQAAG